MGIVVGEAFVDYGNTAEYTVGQCRAYERLSGDRVRLYLTEEKGDKHVLLYTAVLPISALTCIGKKCIDIVGQVHVLPDWAVDRVTTLAS